MKTGNAPLIYVPSQTFLDAAMRNAREERANTLQQLTGWIVRAVTGLWSRQSPTAGPGATAGCS